MSIALNISIFYFNLVMICPPLIYKIGIIFVFIQFITVSFVNFFNIYLNMEIYNFLDNLITFFLLNIFI